MDIGNFIKKNIGKAIESSIYYSPHIPEKKLANATASMNITDNFSSVIALYDNTLFGSASDGIVVTENKFYFKRFKEPGVINYSDIGHCFNTSDTVTVVLRDNNIVEIPKMSGYECSFLSEILNEIAANFYDIKEDAISEEVEGKDIWLDKNFWENATSCSILKRFAKEELIPSDFVVDKDLLEKSVSYTTLHWAALVDNENAVAELLKMGANPNDCGLGGESPLHVAACYSGSGIVNQLIQYGANIDCKSGDSYSTPLHSAAQGNLIRDSESSIKKTMILIEAGANLYAEDKDGNKFWFWGVDHLEKNREIRQKYRELIQCVLLASISETVEKNNDNSHLNDDKPTLEFENTSDVPQHARKITDLDAISSLDPVAAQIRSGNLLTSGFVKISGNVFIQDLVTQRDNSDIVTGVIRSEDGNLQNFADFEKIGSVGFLALSRLVGQAHMAEINKSLLDIRDSINVINFFQENERKGKILGSLEYIQQKICSVDDFSEIENRSLLMQIESHESKLIDIQSHLNMDINDLSKRLSEEKMEYADFEKKCSQFSPLFSQLFLVLVSRNLGILLKEEILSKAGILNKAGADKSGRGKIRETARILASQFSESCCNIIDNLENVKISFWGPSRDKFENKIGEALMEAAVNLRTSIKDFGGDLFYDRKEPEFYIETNESGDRIKNLYIANNVD